MKTKKVVYQAGDVSQFCDTLALYGQRVSTNVGLEVLKFIGGDVDLAITAMLLTPRPAWLKDIAGDL